MKSICENNDVLSMVASRYVITAKSAANTKPISSIKNQCGGIYWLPVQYRSASIPAAPAESQQWSSLIIAHLTGLIQSGGITGQLSVSGGGSGECSSASH